MDKLQTTEAGSAAFPFSDNSTYLNSGLTKLEYFSGLAMQGLVQHAKAETYASIAAGSIKMAKELLSQLDTETNGK